MTGSGPPPTDTEGGVASGEGAERIRRRRKGLIASVVALACLTALLATTTGWLLATDGGRNRPIALPDHVSSYTAAPASQRTIDWAKSASRRARSFHAATEMREYVKGGTQLRVVVVRTELPEPPPGLVRSGSEEPTFVRPGAGVTCRVSPAGNANECVRSTARLSISVKPTSTVSAKEVAHVIDSIWRRINS